MASRPHPDRIYGHDATERIVAVEFARQNQVEVFTRLLDGTTQSQREPLRPWLVTDRPDVVSGHSHTTQELAGDLPLKYRIDFANWGAFRESQDRLRESQAHVHRFAQPVDQYLIATGRTQFKEMDFDDLVRVQIDLETTGLSPDDPNASILAVALSSNRGEPTVLATGDMSESEMLEALTQWLRDLDPDVIEGHNIYNFDLPFLLSRAGALGLRLRWGRDLSEPRDLGIQRFKAGARSVPFRACAIYGRHIIDTYQQIQRYDYAGEMQSYGLKESVEALGLTKVDRVFVPGDQIASTWEHDRSRVLAYALDDVNDVAMLSDLATQTEFYQTQILPRPFQRVAVGGPGEKINALMTRVYLSEGHSLPLPQPARGYPGGYTEVKRVGVFRPVVKCDVESLYPAIMLADRIGPKSDVLDVFLPLLEVLTTRRLHAKNEARRSRGADQARWTGIQTSFKVLINSFSGYLGYDRALFNDYDAVTRITLRGQELIQNVVRQLETLNADPIEIDTDGVYFNPPDGLESGNAHEEFVARISRQLPPGINLAYDGSYRGMISLRTKNYALLTDEDRMILKGSGLRSRRDELVLRRFLQDAARAFIEQSDTAVRSIYLDIAAAIQQRTLPPEDISRSETITEKTFTSDSNKRFAVAAEGERIGERVRVYQRADGELVRLEDYDRDEDVNYLLRRLNDMGKRFEPLLPTAEAFDYIFPKLTAQSDIDAIRVAPPIRQMQLFE
ncbi:MAG TPA: 3'-5' exonuclease [Nitrolancea sp.]|nr:3'-5' exonuclease [Nitrolancea sp.]